ncbi:Plasma membrane t-SNARE, secretory vesicle fusion [Aspergillus nanangensis]|uniref:Plasma membrane t-SNARE, secretory vesicle fusion n=1 Tax=Aspergillus nanangensis TaxID=2582783 RepID=A0AAD4CLG9_ASPNN|nr:Plasma membrane t-SNARE, secretory vesicle fusion [Aspergillus nanangensis]
MNTGNYSYNSNAPYDLEQGHELPQTSSEMTAALNKRRQINDAVENLQQLREGPLRHAQQNLLDSGSAAEDHEARRRLELVEANIDNSFRQVRGLVDELVTISRTGDPHVRTQIGVISRRLQQEIQAYYRTQSEFDHQLRAQVRRRYAIANPEATPEEVDSGVESVLLEQEQVFQIQGARLRQATDAQSAVASRSAAIRKIEQDLMGLQSLLQDVAQLVQQQEPVIEAIESNTEKTAQNTEKANRQLGKAILSAKSMRKYKWWILFVCILIVAVIVAASVGWCKVNNKC